MTHIYKVTSRWTGWPGGPGYTNFYFGSVSSSLPTDLSNFWNQVVAYVPTGITVQADSSGYVIEDSTGLAVGTWSTAASTARSGSSTGAYAGPAGACMTWRTSTVNAKGHLIKGRTFLVPLGANALATNGGLATGCQNALQVAAAAVIGMADPFRIFRRPTTKGGADGTSAEVTSVTVPSFMVTLRSRRD